MESLEARALLSTYTISEFSIFTNVRGVSVQVNNNPATLTYNPTSPVIVNTASGTNTVNILNTSAGFPVEIAGHGSNIVNVGTNGSVAGIVGAVSIQASAGSAGSNTLYVNDSTDTTGRTVTLSNYEGFGTFGSITGLAPASISYEYANTSRLWLTAGTGSNTIDVQATRVPVVISDGGSGVVNVGNNGSVQGIQAPLAHVWGE